MDGKVLANDQGVWASFRDLPEAPTRYVLDVEAQRSPRWTPFAPEVATRFTFGSARTGTQVYLPVPTLRITGPFDDLNRAGWVCGVPAGRRDDLAECSRGGAKALVGHPGGSEFVSLKVKAVDAAGNSVEQMTMRAHGVNRSLG